MKKIVLPLVLIMALLSSTVAFAAGSLNLPGYQVGASWHSYGSDPNGGMFTITLSGVGDGFDVHNGDYAGWCVQADKFTDTTLYTLYSSDDPAMPADAAALRWDWVNYLLNHKAGSAWDVQQAMWVLLGQKTLAQVSPAAGALAQSVMASGTGFVPAPGQTIAVILYYDGFGTPNDTIQEMIIEVQVPSRGGPGTGTPGYWKNHPEAWPVDSITIGEETYTKDQAITLMGMSDGDKTYTVFRGYVAAFLNVQIGNESSCITSELAAAYAWLDMYEPGSGVAAKSAAWKAIEPAYTTLDQYNNGLLCAPHRD